MRLQIREFDLRRVELRLRMPFRYGIATMTEAPLLFVRLAVEIGGRIAQGVSSDLLPPKWFTKVPDKPVDAEAEEMLRVIHYACQQALTLRGSNPFALWRDLYEAQAAAGLTQQWPPLLAHFGTSLVERALLDAIARNRGQPLWQLLRDDWLGIDLASLHPELRGCAPGDLLPRAPLPQVVLRHTIGLGDALTDDAIGPGEQRDDGLPQSLQACLERYRLRHFKIKLSGQVEPDGERLRALAALLHSHAEPDYAFSLDGNEQFTDVTAFREFWENIAKEAALEPFLRHLLFVEQPLHRDGALCEEIAPAFAAWPERPPIIIDESDAELSSLPTALRLGYAGTSHKNCKGVFKGIANGCLIRHGREVRRLPLLMSGEDLCTVGPVALLQDLAAMAALGIESVERNGHHYHPGLSCLPARMQEQVLTAHDDLYERSRAGWPTLRIRDGRVRLDSVNAAPFGCAPMPWLEDLVQVAKCISS